MSNSRISLLDWTYIGVGPNDGKVAGQFIPILYRKNTYTLLDFTNVWLSPTPKVPSKGDFAGTLRPPNVGLTTNSDRLGCSLLEPSIDNWRVQTQPQWKETRGHEYASG